MALSMASLHLQILRVIGSQSGQRHAGHVGIGLVAGDSPAAVGGLHTQNFINQRLTGDDAAGGHGVVAGIQCQQCPDRTVVALVLDELQVTEASQQVVAANVVTSLPIAVRARIIPGIVRGLGLVEPSGVGVNTLLHILHSLLVVILHARGLSVRTGPGR